MSIEGMPKKTTDSYHIAPLAINNWNNLNIRQPNEVFVKQYSDNVLDVLSIIPESSLFGNDHYTDFAINPAFFMHTMFRILGISDTNDIGSYVTLEYPSTTLGVMFKAFSLVRQIEATQTTLNDLIKNREKIAQLFTAATSAMLWSNFLEIFPIQALKINPRILARNATSALLLAEILDDVTTIQEDLGNQVGSSLIVRALYQTNEAEKVQKMISSGRSISIAALLKRKLESPQILREHFHGYLGGISQAPQDMRDFYTHQFYNLESK